MNFEFTSEQNLLASSVRQCFERLPKSPNRLIAGTAEAALPRLKDMGQDFGALGILGILASEEAGGLGMGFVDATLVALESGRECVAFPIIESIVTSYYLARARPNAACSIINGETLGTAASQGELLAIPESGLVRLEGTVLAPYASRARWLSAAALADDGTDYVALIDLSAGGIDIEPVRSLDLTYLMDRVSIHAVAESKMLIPGRLGSVLGLLSCGEIVGAAARVLESTVSHLQNRVQFGVPIGKNQALKHIAADDHVCIENMRVGVEYAAWSFDNYRARRTAGVNHDHTAVDKAYAVAKSYCSRAARKVAQDGVQLHGGMGFTWEQGLHLLSRRILRLATSCGTVYEQNEVLAKLILEPPRGGST
jgi:alkylation response protein AidB-like acyl-CoA dehydrogenase